VQPDLNITKGSFSLYYLWTSLRISSKSRSCVGCCSWPKNFLYYWIYTWAEEGVYL